MCTWLTHPCATVFNNLKFYNLSTNGSVLYGCQFISAHHPSNKKEEMHLCFARFENLEKHFLKMIKMPEIFAGGLSQQQKQDWFETSFMS
jgi:hypothetical protein